MLSDSKWGVNGVCMCLTLAFVFVSLTIIRSHRPHLPSLSISARLFCPGNAPIELPGEEARARTNYGLYNIRFNGTKIWNSIGEDIKQSSLKTFKEKLKREYINIY